jgi:adenosylcobinamide kinase/adenosylcobinamide-phosphate guanylyltransferase
MRVRRMHKPCRRGNRRVAGADRRHTVPRVPTSILFTGGARSGKSRLARAWAEGRDGPRTYIATAVDQDGDAEMAARIARHRAEREACWADTVEVRLDLAGAIGVCAHAGTRTALVDCVTLWLGNLGLHHAWDEPALLAAVEELARILAAPPLDLAVVTNEVGSGIVPEHALGRRFRDLQGFANQRLAAAAQAVALVTCGLPLWLKQHG